MRASRLTSAAALLLMAGAAAAETITYSYDARGRLVGVQRSGDNTSYAYDRADNRVSKVITASNPVSVSDFSFEAPEVGNGYVYNPSVPGMNFVSRAGVTANNTAWGFHAAPDGDQVAFLESTSAGTGTISHSVTGLSAGTSYRLSALVAQRPGYATTPFAVRVNGTVLATFTPTSPTFSQVTTPAFTATASTATVEFVGQATNSDAGTGIDKVVIAPGPP